MNSLLIIIATATMGSALPVPLTTVSRYTTPGELHWFEDAEDFVATAQIGNDDYGTVEWEAPPSDYDGSEMMQALYESEWIPDEAGDGGGGGGGDEEEELLVGAASGGRGFHMRQGAWRRGVRAYDPHHWNRVPRAHRKPHPAEDPHATPNDAARPTGGASE